MGKITYQFPAVKIFFRFPTIILITEPDPLYLEESTISVIVTEIF